MITNTEQEAADTANFNAVIDAIRADDFSQHFGIETSFNDGRDSERARGYLRLAEKDPRRDRPKPHPVVAWFSWTRLGGWMTHAPRDAHEVVAEQDPAAIARDLLGIMGDLCAAADDEDHPDYPGVH